MSKVQEVLAQFKPVNLRYDIATLPADIKSALPHLKRAMDLLTKLFLNQQDEGLAAHYQATLAGDDASRKEFYQLFLGPFNPLDHHKSLFADHADRRTGCAFYPPDLTAESFRQYLDSVEPAVKERLTDTTTLVRNAGDGLQALDYHLYYAAELGEIASAIQAAAALINHPGLKEYLTLRAQSMVQGDYRAADAAWVSLRETPIEFVFGPYEVYADGLMGLKAMYEGMLMATDSERGRRLHEIEESLTLLAQAIPLPAGSRGALGKIAPMVVVNMLYAAGEARQGIMASAFNLPNDPWVRGNVGWKQVMISNIMAAKFDNCTKPIGQRVLGEGCRAEFEPYFFFVLLHEVSHGLGPAYRADDSSVAKAMGSYYTAIEEAKADVGALHLMLAFGGKHGIPAFPLETVLDSVVAGLFRSMRFGIHEAHGAANVIQYNWFCAHGVISHTNAATPLLTHSEHLIKATGALLDRLCQLQAAGTLEQIKEFCDAYGQPTPVLEETFARLKDIPVDIRPTFVL